MNLFIIPSWYPTPQSKLSGMFTREQAEAIADLAPDVRVIVSTWGHDRSHLPIRKPIEITNRLRWYLAQPKNNITSHQGVHEVFNPALTWTERLPFGGVNQLLPANRRNMELAFSHFGKIDLIHAHVSYPGGYIASVLGREFSIPYVLTEHMSPFPFPSLLRNGRPLPVIDEAFTHAKAVISVSPSAAERIASFGYQIPRIIPNVVDERRFHLGASTTSKRIFFTLCGLSDQKGIDHLLEAIALWDPPPDQYEFRIGGDGPMRAAYQDMADNLGIADRVRWLGPVSREAAPQLFRDCHIYIMPSRHESFGVVYAEAIASGKPVIATRCGGPEYIVTERNGLLVEIGDIPGLVKAMKYISANLSNYDPQAIREDFLARFSRPAVVSQLLALYQQVLGAA